jgi:hypothetical protein
VLQTNKKSHSTKELIQLNTKSKVLYFTAAERMPASSWQAWAQSAHTYIHHHIAVAGMFAPGGFSVNCLTKTKIHTYGES